MKSPPLTEADLRQRYRGGESLAVLFNLAFRRAGWSRQRVRVILFGRER